MRDAGIQREIELGKEVEEMKGRQGILVVEDETIMRESLKDWLQEGGYQVATAEDGEQALQMAQEQEFGVAVLDLRLPGKDGIEVLREVKERQPQLKGIIITAYPSVETAVEAIKVGAVDYLTKPFAPDELEKLIEQVLGPVQLEIRPEAHVEIVEEAVEEAEVEEIIAITEEEFPVHLQLGKEHFAAGQLQEALKEFQAVLKVAPGNIETRVWIGKTTKAIAEQGTEAGAGGEAIAAEAKPNYCVWMAMGMVSYRVCTNSYNCVTCEFDQTMQEKLASGGGTELDEVLERFKRLPGYQRLCRYALKGDVTHRLCTRLFQCATCEFGQMMDDALQLQLAQRQAEIAARQEAIGKKGQSWWWRYWG